MKSSSSYAGSARSSKYLVSLAPTVPVARSYIFDSPFALTATDRTRADGHILKVGGISQYCRELGNIISSSLAASVSLSRSNYYIPPIAEVGLL